MLKVWLCYNLKYFRITSAKSDRKYVLLSMIVFQEYVVEFQCQHQYAKLNWKIPYMFCMCCVHHILLLFCVIVVEIVVTRFFSFGPYCLLYCLNDVFKMIYERNQSKIPFFCLFKKLLIDVVTRPALVPALIISPCSICVISRHSFFRSDKFLFS